MIERKYLAHFIDVNFGSGSVEYERIGKDLEEYTEDLSPSVETKQNILGEQSTKVTGYEVSSEVDPYYVDYSDALSTKIMEIANERATGDELKTTKVDVLLKKGATADATPTVVWAYREEILIVPTSAGGDTSGVQYPFTIYNNGNRVKGTWNVTSKAFTPGESLA